MPNPHYLSVKTCLSMGTPTTYPTYFATTTKQNDVAIDDQTTYDETSGPNTVILTVYDLGSAKQLGKFTCRIWCDSFSAFYSFEYSDNGINWTNAFTFGPITTLAPGWISLVQTNIVTSAHRYWRLTFTDGGTLTAETEFLPGGE